MRNLLRVVTEFITAVASVKPRVPLAEMAAKAKPKGPRPCRNCGGLLTRKNALGRFCAHCGERRDG
jgi:hypothetical protein